MSRFIRVASSVFLRENITGCYRSSSFTNRPKLTVYYAYHDYHENFGRYPRYTSEELTFIDAKERDASYDKLVEIVKVNVEEL